MPALPFRLRSRVDDSYEDDTSAEESAEEHAYHYELAGPETSPFDPTSTIGALISSNAAAWPTTSFVNGSNSKASLWIVPDSAQVLRPLEQGPSISNDALRLTTMIVVTFASGILTTIVFRPRLEPFHPQISPAQQSRDCHSAIKKDHAISSLC